MPNRIIREAILSSERVASLGWPEEVFYRRLMSIVDDYGRCEANPQLLRARCYPLQTDAVRVADISRWMAACQKSGLILVYAVQGKQYAELTNFQQQQRSPSKWPAPLAIDSKCEQVPTNEHLGVVEGVVVDEGVKESTRLSEPAAEHRSIATQLGVDCEAEFGKYRDYLKTHGKSHRNEAAGFRNWLRKAAEFKPKGDLRQSVNTEIWGKRDDRRDITGESERLA